ncbi:hypothetical protein C8J55DRAFT_407748, partial [Lentinula edodes]
FWDDQLTSDEEDLICGCYEVWTGEVHFKSWWPRPISWKSSGFNCGYWSNDAEDWFQQRLNAIRHSSDSIQLLTNNQWRS